MTKLKLRSRIGKKGKSVKKAFLVYFVIGIVIVQVVIINPAQASSLSSIQMSLRFLEKLNQRYARYE